MLTILSRLSTPVVRFLLYLTTLALSYTYPSLTTSPNLPSHSQHTHFKHDPTLITNKPPEPSQKVPKEPTS
ncbi:uncharacterized protein BDZ83DRAFT_602868 [Colletotrichum acutatum]|uniref:Uncharacterized protein n=1 Tax=Glomerella acutata TaxID=27357 RepID=A0AAD8XM94_GLOAC|nr:uncharacterized protein BDZ83DRAFT_602868 [Colletotrichum acutatum]KAK1730037.1 hypothetical protein BDZ83DRAFT_602868 [Colletotrichum acutatum]